MTKSYSAPYSAPRAAAWLIAAALVAAAPQPASADSAATTPGHDPLLDEILAGPEVKRLPNSGRGMPSVMGPFRDTLNMEWLGQIPNRELGASRLIWTGAAFLSDIWGWVSPVTGDEYAIVGHNSGIAFVRVTDPRNPEFLGTIATVNTKTLDNWWWDIKTYNDHAYFVSEVHGTGVGVFELTKLDGMAAAPAGTLLDADARYQGNGYVAAHNISINEDSGFAYLTGVTKDHEVDPGFVEEGMVILDLNGDPLAPTEAGQVNGRDTHDAQIVSYHGPDPDHAGKEIAFVFNGEDLTVGIYDVTDKQVIDVSLDSSITIAEADYAGASFTHQGWVTEDHRFLVAGDEEDELFGLQDPRNPYLPDSARTYVWNIQDLDNPTMVSSFDSPAASIDHNLFARTDPATGREFVYHANYTAGVRVTELTREGDAGTAQIARLAEIAHMDTEPRMSNNHINMGYNIWAGPWGVYPFLGSGTIMASDGLNGLVLMRLALP
ncbi:MAG: choice-of-anchor B family protein [Alphaproteobacteria bacterium]|nr:choice-of-anchor B family protein [Alphaproteobacteria bacterium]